MISKLFFFVLFAVSLTVSASPQSAKMITDGAGRLLLQHYDPISGEYQETSKDHGLPVRILGDYFTAVGFSQIPGHSRVSALGNNPDIDVAAPEDVWTGGGTYPWMPAATSLEIVSGCADDSASGIGARTVLVNTLSGTYAELPQILTMNGTSAVPLPSQGLRINPSFILTAGTNRTNVCDITIRDAGGGATRAVIPAGYGITRQSAYTIPAGKTLSIVSFVFSITRAGGATKSATIATFIQTSANVYRLPLELEIATGSPYLHPGQPGVVLPEKTDFAFRVTAVTAENTNVTAAWLGVLKTNGVD